MSIRMLARDLYQSQQYVDRLQKEYDAALPHKKPEIETALRRARSQRDQLRRMLNGQIDR
jgi:hypothetical protein